jgi:hypothetical protein
MMCGNANAELLIELIKYLLLLHMSFMKSETENFTREAIICKYLHKLLKLEIRLLANCLTPATTRCIACTYGD